MVDGVDGPEIAVIDAEAPDMKKLAHRIQVPLYALSPYMSNFGEQHLVGQGINTVQLWSVRVLPLPTPTRVLPSVKRFARTAHHGASGVLVDPERVIASTHIISGNGPGRFRFLSTNRSGLPRWTVSMLPTVLALPNPHALADLGSAIRHTRLLETSFDSH